MANIPVVEMVSLSVADLATLASARGYVDGQRAFVESVKGFFTFCSDSNQASDGRTAISTPDGYNTRWLFDTTFSHPDWRLGITDVYVDDVSGTNENQGIYTSVPGTPAPITSKEFYLRWGRHNLIATGDLVNLSIQIHISNTISDALNVVCKTGIDTYLRFLGENTSTVISGTLTGYTNQNPTGGSGGTAAEITDTGVASFSAYIGKRIRFTSNDATAIILKATAANKARISQPVTTDEPAFDGIPHVVNPIAGAAYVIEDLVSVNLGEWSLIAHDGSNYGYTGQTNVADIFIAKDATPSSSPWQSTSLNGAVANILAFYRCVWERDYDMASQNVYQIGCGATGNVFTVNFGTQRSNTCWFGCGIVPNSSSIKVIRICGGPGPQDYGYFDYYTYVQGACVVFEGDCSTGAFAVWDAPTHATYNPGGHGICVGQQTPDTHTLGGGSLSIRSANPIFGNGNAGVGIRANANSTITYQILPNIIGSGGDFQLGDAAAGWWWDATAGVYKPVGAGISLTWAHLSAAKGVAGFGDAAHELDKNVHISKINST